jgi:hypothetical protein
MASSDEIAGTLNVMKPENEIIPSDPSRRAIEEREELKGARTDVTGERAPRILDSEVVRRDLHRRSTTPFVFNPWLHGSPTKETEPATKWFKRFIITVMGATVLAAGVLMIVLPGPALIVIPVGLAILAVEFAWARRWLRSVRAILPRPKADDPRRQKVTLTSVRRCRDFLFRQVHRTLPRKRNPN